MQDDFFFSAGSCASGNVFILFSPIGSLARKEDTWQKAAQEDRLLQIYSCTNHLATTGLLKYIHFYVRFYGIHHRVFQYCAQTNAGLGMAQFLLRFLPVQH